MERFNSIYPFTTENISGYMNDLSLSKKKIITVTGSSDHIINAVLKGATNITTFDINPLTENYMDLKLSAIKKLSYEEFLQMFLFDSSKKIDYDFILSLDMKEESKSFWINQLLLYNSITIRNSKIFNTKYFNPNSKIWQNMYLTNKENYEEVRKKLEDVDINFINTSLRDLTIESNFDYMFLSNISDYISLMYENEELTNYRNLITSFSKTIDNIYFAYLYDIGNSNPRSEIDNIHNVKKAFGEIEIKTFKSALESEENKKDGVLILRRK